ncbi:DUF6402 family protein [Campylobacter devanensis]|uniref:DUF6402 family protein n=1 Tax=Campylobacter devanensis TaxID=3161138 RepID=UPI001F2268F0|nr:DUF6402 family protein [Campylobacter sp. P0023]
MSEITIRAVENISNLPIEDLELFLEEADTKSKSLGKTNGDGLAVFTVDDSNKFRLYAVCLNEQNHYKIVPMYDRCLISHNAIDEIQELRFYKYTDVFRINLYSKTGRYCFQKGDKVDFKAYYPDHIEDKDIKWAYTCISKDLTLKDVLQGKKLTQGDEEELEQYPVKCLNNAKYYTLKDKNNQAYLGKEVKDYEISNMINDSKMIIFAYTKEPLDDVYTELVLGDIIQISIDCSMQEALNAKDEVSKLGWTTSYVLQRLWHDNPRNATKISQLKYKNSQELCQSIEDETMKALIKQYAPDIELKPFEIKQLNKASIDPCNFYVELDWEEFYLKFPLVKERSKELLNISSFLLLNPNPHLSDNVKTHIIQKLFHQQRLCRNNPKENCLDDTGISNTKQDLKYYSQLKNIADIEELDLIVHTENIKNAKIETELTFSVYPKDKFLSIHDEYKRIDTLRPYDIDKATIQQGVGISDEDFEWKLASNDEQTSAQALALYACTGKFSIYYIPSKFLLKKEYNKTYVYIKELYAYIWDTFDFDDEGHSYEKDKELKDENITQLGQPVGTWDYKEMRFDFNHSVRQMRAYKLPFPKKYTCLQLYLLSFLMPSLQQDIIFDTKRISKLKQDQIYPLYNQDYQNYKKTFNKGLNFRVFSKDKTNDKIHKGFYILKVPEDKATQKYFRIEL